MSVMPEGDLKTNSPVNLDGANLIIASPDSIAEACFSIPAVRAIHNSFNRCKITIIVPDDLAALWNRVDEIDHVIVFPASDSARKIVKILEGIDGAFDASLAWSYGAPAQAFSKMGIKTRLGFPERKLSKHLTDPIAVTKAIGPIEHRVTDYLQFVQSLGTDAYQAANFTTPPRKAPGSSFSLGIAPGSDYGPAAEWPLEKFVTLAEDLRKHCQIVIVPTPGHSKPASLLANALSIPEPPSEVGIAEVLESLSRCHGLLTNDSSTAHLSSFAGIPSLVIFGPNEPAWKRPLGKRHRTVRRHVACSSCFLNHCPLDHRCMNELDQEDVLEELRLLFSEQNE